MNKNFTVALIFLVVITLVGVGALALFGTQNSSTEGAEGDGVFNSLFPFLTNPLTGFTGSEETPIVEESGPVPKLRLVSDKPVAGASFSSTGAIRYVEKETGHVYETPPDNLSTTRISNTTIPGIQEVVWVNDNRIILRYMDGDTIESFSGFLASSTPDQSMTGIFLPPAQQIVRADADNILLLVQTASGVRIDSAKPDGTVPRTLFSSPLRSWGLTVVGNEIFLTTAPTAQGQGFIFTLSAGALEKVFGGQLGLITLPNPTGRYVAYSASAPDRSTFGVYDRDTGATIPLPAGTIATKCVWLPTETPILFCGVPLTPVASATVDEWLMGGVSYEDRAWLLYPEIRTAEIILSLTDSAREPIDIINPVVSSDGKHVLFINKNDSRLWSLTLSQNQ